MIQLKRLTEDNQYETIGEVDPDNPSEEALELASESFWQEATDEEILSRFDGPHLVADRVD